MPTTFLAVFRYGVELRLKSLGVATVPARSFDLSCPRGSRGGAPPIARNNCSEFRGARRAAEQYPSSAPNSSAPLGEHPRRASWPERHDFRPPATGQAPSGELDDWAGASYFGSVADPGNSADALRNADLRVGFYGRALPYTRPSCRHVIVHDLGRCWGC